MSYNRLILRLSAVAALANFWKDADNYPTLAGNLIFDSKVEPIENMEIDVVYPTIVVYTDYDKNGIAHQSVPHTERLTTVTFELLMAVMQPAQEGVGYIIHTPTTDTELEASLDVLEAQMFAALRAKNSAANCFNTMAYGVDSITSRRGATVEGGTKIAARQVTAELKTIQELANPLLAPYIATFLDDLATSPGCQRLEPQVRALYTASNSLDSYERIRRSMGWSEEAHSKLGYPLPNAPVLPPNITWLDQHGNPF